MIAVIGLESIGDDATFRFGRYMDLPTGGTMRDHARYLLRPKAWVAEILGLCSRFGFRRRFLPYKKDYYKASGNGARGVYKWYEIADGAVVEVNSPQSWKRADRYFAVSSGGLLRRITREDVTVWIETNQSANTD